MYGNQKVIRLRYSSECQIWIWKRKENEEWEPNYLNCLCFMGVEEQFWKWFDKIRVLEFPMTSHAEDTPGIHLPSRTNLPFRIFLFLIPVTQCALPSPLSNRYRWKVSNVQKGLMEEFNDESWLPEPLLGFLAVKCK